MHWRIQSILGTKNLRHNDVRNRRKTPQNLSIQADEQQTGQFNDQTTGHEPKEPLTHGW